MNDQAYHYTESGLDYVYLVGGVDVVGAPGRQKVIIKDLEGLHRAIGRYITTQRESLSGADARFLRHELLMSQTTLAHLLNVSEQAVHRWEKGKTAKVPGSAQALLRLLYLETTNQLPGGGSKGNIAASLKRIAKLEDQIDGAVNLVANDDGWQPEPAKAA